MLPFKVQNLSVDVVGASIRFDDFDLLADTSVLVLEEAPLDGGTIELSGLKGFKPGRTLVVCLKNVAGFNARFWHAMYSASENQLVLASGGPDAAYGSKAGAYITLIFQYDGIWAQPEATRDFATLQAAYDYARSTYSPFNEAVASPPGVFIPQEERLSLEGDRRVAPMVSPIDRSTAGVSILSPSVVSLSGTLRPDYLFVKMRTGRTASGVVAHDGAATIEPKVGVQLRHTYSLVEGIGIFRKKLSSAGPVEITQGFQVLDGLRQHVALLPRTRRASTGEFIFGVSRLRTDGAMTLNGAPASHSGVMRLYHGQSLDPVGPVAPALAVGASAAGGYRATWSTPLDLDFGQVMGYELEVDGRVSDVGLVNEFEGSLYPGVPVSVRVRAYDDDALRGSWSVMAVYGYVATTTRAPMPETTQAPRTFSRTVRLRWVNVPGASRYDVLLDDTIVRADVPRAMARETVVTLMDLADGAHRIEVLAKDNGGNVSLVSNRFEFVIGA